MVVSDFSSSSLTQPPRTLHVDGDGPRAKASQAPPARSPTRAARAAHVMDVEIGFAYGCGGGFFRGCGTHGACAALMGWDGRPPRAGMLWAARRDAARAERVDRIAFEGGGAYWPNDNSTEAGQALWLKNADPIMCDRQRAPHPVATAGVRYFHATSAVSKHSITPAPPGFYRESLSVTSRTTLNPTTSRIPGPGVNGFLSRIGSGNRAVHVQASALSTSHPLLRRT